VQTRRVQFWVWWLLPLMVARAMLPVGFMPSWNGAGITLCSGVVLQQDPSQPADSTHSDLTCPFAHAPGAAPLPVLPVLAAFHGQIIDRIEPVAQLQISFSPLRSHRVRGPPVLI
jgi:hypothetical protein